MRTTLPTVRRPLATGLAAALLAVGAVACGGDEPAPEPEAAPEIEGEEEPEPEPEEEREPTARERRAEVAEDPRVSNAELLDELAAALQTDGFAAELGAECDEPEPDQLVPTGRDQLALLALSPLEGDAMLDAIRDVGIELRAEGTFADGDLPDGGTISVLAGDGMSGSAFLAWNVTDPELFDDLEYRTCEDQLAERQEMLG